jgi:hypothetical protein
MRDIVSTFRNVSTGSDQAQLSSLAEGGINQAAADAAHTEDKEPVGAVASGARKSQAKSGRQ